jgi:hypothetical protein
MSRILRRPMFRGGRVDSRGTGITSGLMDEGQIGGGTIYGEQMSDGRYGFQDPIYRPSIEEIISSFGPVYDPEKEAKEKLLKYQEEMTPKGYTEDPSGLTTVAPGKLFFEFGKDERADILKLTQPDGIKSYVKENIGKRNEQIKNIMETTKNLSQDQRDTILKRFNVTQKDISGTIGGEEDEGVSKIVSRPTPKTRREEIMEEADLYKEILGFNEARAQAGFDALGAAAPAFFQGKNLREAAPKIFESINKSEAFQKPLSIKQAAGNLAIQRGILKDKAKAEELARLAIYGMKNRETITDLVKGIPGSFVAGVLPKGIEKNPTLQASLRPGGIYSTTEGEYFYAVPSAKGDKVSGLQKLG